MINLAFELMAPGTAVAAAAAATAAAAARHKKTPRVPHLNLVGRFRTFRTFRTFSDVFGCFRTHSDVPVRGTRSQEPTEYEEPTEK